MIPPCPSPPRSSGTSYWAACRLPHHCVGDQVGRHLRFSPGGFTDLEFIAAWGQLRHGERDPALRTTHPPAALQRMADRGELAAVVLDDYRFLQRAGLRLRLIRDQHDDRLQAQDRSPLARSLGMSEGQLDYELSKRMARVRVEFLRRLG